MRITLKTVASIGLATALAALAVPASAKTWVDEACVYLLVSDEAEAAFMFQTTDGKVSIECTVDQWPISSPDAVMACSNGVAPIMTVPGNGEIWLDGIRFFPKGDGRIVCD